MNERNERLKGFHKREETADHSFAVGYSGIKDILIPPDGKAEFIIYDNDQIFVKLDSSFAPKVLYPFSPVSFKPKAKAVLMDLDGTSADSEEFWVWIIQRTMQELMKDRGFQLSGEDIPYVSGYSVSEHLQYCINKYAPYGDIAEARKLYYGITDYEMKEILHGRGKTGAFKPRRYLKEFLTELKQNHIKIGLVTSGLYEKALPEILSVFRQLDLGDPLEFYDAVITAGTTYRNGQSGTLGELCAKPHPWLYSEISRVGLGISEEDMEHVIVLEDSSAGVLAGALAGYSVVGMSDGNINKAGLDSLTCLLADDLTQALKYILGD